MAQPVLLVLSDPADPYIPILDELRDRAELFVGTGKDLLKHAARADALLAWVFQQSEVELLLPQASRLKWMHARWAGLDALLFPALVDSPIVLTNSRGVYSRSLAEFVIMSALFFAKDVRRLLTNQSRHVWEPFTVLELRGATMGIAGYGDIGRACAALAHSFGMRVLASRRRPELSHGDPYISRTYGPNELVPMIADCDHVVAAAPLTPETRGMIGEREIAAMKSTAVLINVGRGAIVDESALLHALKNRSIRGAVLDVFATEPLPSDHPFYELDNLLLSPHCADQTPSWNEDAMRAFLANFERFLDGKPLENIVDKPAGY